MLQHALHQPIGETGDIELACSFLSLLKHPAHVLRIIAIESAVEWILLVPLNNLHIFDAMLGQPRRVCDRAKWIRDLGRKQIQRAVDASRHTRQNDPSVAFEAFSSAINQRNDRSLIQRAIVLVLQHRNEHSVDPAARDNRIQATDDDVEFTVVRVVEVLDLAEVRSHFASWNSLVYEISGDLGLRGSDVLTAEEELTVQV